jgi:uncharacterized integral membrane protein
MSGTLTEEWFLKVYKRTYFQSNEFTASLPAVYTHALLLLLLLLLFHAQNQNKCMFLIYID